MLSKVELAKLAQEIGLESTAVHYRPGTSKANRIEHRMFSLISTHWRGRPLVSYRTIVELISAAAAAAGARYGPKKISATRRPAPSSAPPNWLPVRARRVVLTCVSGNGFGNRRFHPNKHVEVGLEVPVTGVRAGLRVRFPQGHSNACHADPIGHPRLRPVCGDPDGFALGRPPAALSEGVQSPSLHAASGAAMQPALELGADTNQREPI
jgi:hypothetical protein